MSADHYDDMTDAELVNAALGIIILISERFEIRTRETQELNGEINEYKIPDPSTPDVHLRYT